MKTIFRPIFFMPKHACRIFLKIKSIRVERLQEITEADAIAEGVKDDGFFEGLYNYYNYLLKVFIFKKARDSFMSLWQKINGNGAWNLNNPFVWVYEFEKIERPNDFLE